MAPDSGCGGSPRESKVIVDLLTLFRYAGRDVNKVEKAIEGEFESDQ